MDLSALYQDLLSDVSARLVALPDKPEETPDGIVSALWHRAAGACMSVQRAVDVPLPGLGDHAIAKLRGLVAQRIAGVPLAYLTGRQQFMDLELHVAPGSLIPRQETELLGRSALAALQALAGKQDRVTVIDVCTGSGNLAVALAHHVPQAFVFASDLSPDAVELARQNVRHLGLEERAEVRQGDLLMAFEDPAFHGAVDLITCNPPYISTGKLDVMPEEIIAHEPRMAFDGGPFGVKILSRFIQEAPHFLREGGWMGFEVGLGQGPAMLKRLELTGGFREIVPIVDPAGNIRGIMAAV